MAKTSSSTVRAKKVKTTSAVKPGEAGWQAEKSAMTQLAIMQAAVECLIELGYTKATTSLIAEYAGVSRGAMMHHYPSRMSVITAVVGYLHDLRLKEYRELMSGIDNPSGALTQEIIKESVTAAWDYVNLPSFVAYQELLAASRTDEELKEIMAPVEKDFEKQFLKLVRGIFPHWANTDPTVLEAAHDMVQFLMKGMSLSHMSMRREARSQKVMEYLTLVLQQMYLEGNR